MKISVSSKLKSSKGLLLALFTEEELKKIPSKYPEAIKKFTQDRIKNNKYKAEKSSKLHTYLDSKKLPEQLLLLGLGKREKFDKKNAREVGAEISKHISGLKQNEVTFLISKTVETYFYEFMEGVLFAQYKTELYKSKKVQAERKKKNTDSTLQKLNIITENKALKTLAQKAEIVASAMNYVKNLVNSPANIVDSEYFEKEAKKIAKDNRYKKTILSQAALEKMKAGGILAVNQGCDKDAKLIALEYKGSKNKKEKPIIIVGKGVIFDTGGYNLKRSGHIEEMHQDMAGAATVMGLMKVLKELGIKKNVIGIIPLVENLINQDAYRPSDIITMLSGNTVEITNTDAEGRLILADALHYASEKDPASIISIATLTGAVFAALGHRYSGLMGNDPELISELKKSGETVDDLAWELPIHEDYRKEMDSKIADFRNYDKGSGGGAGSSKAAAFLEKFVQKKKWCHIDIGGTAFTSKAKKYEQTGATAHGLRMLIEFLEG